MHGNINILYHLKKYILFLFCILNSIALSFCQLYSNTPIEQYPCNSDINTKNFRNKPGKEIINKEDTVIVRFYHKYLDTLRISREHIYVRNNISYKIRHYYFFRKNCFYVKTSDKRGLDIKTEPWKFYYLSGKLWSEGLCINNKLEGLSKGYYENGAIQYTCFFKKNRLNGKLTIFYPNGRLYSITSYNNNLPIDTMFAFYNNGRKWTERVYNPNGKLLKISYLIDSTGKSLNLGSFKNGTGIVYNYNVRGEIIEYEKYKNGKLKKTIKNGNLKN